MDMNSFYRTLNIQKANTAATNVAMEASAEKEDGTVTLAHMMCALTAIQFLGQQTNITHSFHNREG